MFVGATKTVRLLNSIATGVNFVAYANVLQVGWSKSRCKQNVVQWTIMAQKESQKWMEHLAHRCQSSHQEPVLQLRWHQSKTHLGREERVFWIRLMWVHFKVKREKKRIRVENLIIHFKYLWSDCLGSFIYPFKAQILGFILIRY